MAIRSELRSTLDALAAVPERRRDETLIVQAIYLTVGLSVLAHGLTAAPLANRYARWYEQHLREKGPSMESALAEV